MALPTLKANQRAFIYNRTAATRLSEEPGLVPVAAFGWESLSPAQAVNSVIEDEVDANNLRYVVRTLPAAQ